MALTLQEKQLFFSQVKGKKIIWSGRKDVYFIPDNIENIEPYKLIGKIYSCLTNNLIDSNTKSSIYNGFNKNTEGYAWSFYDDSTIPTQQRQASPDQKGKIKCICDWAIVFRYGCKCGAFSKGDK